MRCLSSLTNKMARQGIIYESGLKQINLAKQLSYFNNDNVINTINEVQEEYNKNYEEALKARDSYLKSLQRLTEARANIIEIVPLESLCDQDLIDNENKRLK